MKRLKTKIEGLALLEPSVFGDERGYFFESYQQKRFEEEGLPTNYVQDNQSSSSKGTLRGLHFQNPPFEQGKLVRVIKGAVLDVVVDIRKKSPTFGKYESFELNENNKHILWIPPGFAHGFYTFEDDTIFVYKCTGQYHKASENGIIWNDPDLKIDWGEGHKIISEKDKALQMLKNLNSPF